uniref:Zinc finger homeobox protein 3 n=1 Tax=Anthurium amnicola TaxID=1678845 RepID=A0A1D1YLB7_9ARAE
MVVGLNLELLMAAISPSSSSSMASGVTGSSHLCARRDGPPHLVAALASSPRRTPSLRLGAAPFPSRSSSSVVSSARRGKNTSAAARRLNSNREKKSLHADEEDIDEDAFEALFSQLEEDLKNDNLSDGDTDDEITEEDLARFEEELADALGDEVEENGFTGELSFDSEHVNDSDDDEEDYRPPKLKNWQLRRLASALKIGRRKTSIKNLSAELGLDRAIVLEFLRDPPPNLLLMAASLPDRVTESPSEPHVQGTPLESLPIKMDVAETESKVEVPVHVMKTRWSMNKRLKKVQVETLERVYARTKRPTNAMISSIVHVTNLPRKTVVKWFEDKRVQDGVPKYRSPFRRSEYETVSGR